VVGQITNPARGRIPDDPRPLLHRAYGERVRRALVRGCDRKTVMDVFRIVKRTIWYTRIRRQSRRKDDADPADGGGQRRDQLALPSVTHLDKLLPNWAVCTVIRLCCNPLLQISDLVNY